MILVAECSIWEIVWVSLLFVNWTFKPREVVDISGGCGASFEVEVVSEQFEGKRMLERHRMVNAALEEEMKEIHALSIKKAQTPQQWKPSQDSPTTQTKDA
ncbi:unnamed protein product [Arabis nemorensis]|uniref:BolA-like protein n=1 Tax=Arabis nemorensis TaxID=586526 RepID=A0A565CJR8_9BRAS|nr:unnamed protein product [Arabis nemorensis]